MKLATLKALNAARAQRRPIVLVTDVETGQERVVDAAAASDPLAAPIAEQLRKGKSAMVEQDGRHFFLTVHVPPVKLVMTGAVHISQALVPLAKLLGHEA